MLPSAARLVAWGPPSEIQGRGCKGLAFCFATVFKPFGFLIIKLFFIKFKGEGRRVWLFLRLFSIYSDFVIIAKYTKSVKQKHNKYIRKDVRPYIYVVYVHICSKTETNPQCQQKTILFKDRK